MILVRQAIHWTHALQDHSLVAKNAFCGGTATDNPSFRFTSIEYMVQWLDLRLPAQSIFCFSLTSLSLADHHRNIPRPGWLRASRARRILSCYLLALPNLI